ncbi:acyl-ACP--UDP-N-acetylglucosamine O-acyltransferase [Alphaproteobacteria bacterium]|nr:acyl-ACP--UDP-N-acetylglucosamine O-acyltransferase [Alphaproteobacteria bacterium]
MTYQIHPSSFLSKKVKLGSNVRIGPFCNLDGNIEIGDNTKLKSHISISGNTKIGKNNIFYPFSHIGCDPQDLKFKGENSDLIIGDSNIFRENVTISKGTLDGGMLTQIGNNNLFMTGVHVAHDCKIGNKNILVNQVTLGGHVNIMNSVVIGGLSAIIQFVTIGSHTMIGGMSGIDKNVLPFSLVIGNRAKLRGLNLVGIRRDNFSKGEIERIKEVHKCIFSNNFDLDLKTKIDQFFIEYKSLINEKLGHIQE